MADLIAAGIKTNTINNDVVDNVQTPMVKSIATPIIPIQQDYDDIDFNKVMDAKNVVKTTIISNGIIRRPRRSPYSDSSSDYGDIGNNIPYINNIGMGNGGRGNGGGDKDDPGDGGVGSGKGAMGKGFGLGNRRMEFPLVKSSNIIITNFSGSNRNAQPFLPLYKSIKRLIYNPGDDGELPFDILSQVEKCGSETFSNARVNGFTRQCPKAAEFNRAIMSVLVNYTSGNAKAMVEYGTENGTRGDASITIIQHWQ